MIPNSAPCPTLRAERIGSGPIIGPDTPGWADPWHAKNINGPCLIRMPDWATRALGRYHLYFGHHSGKFLRLAYADQIEGPWRIHGPGVLSSTQGGFGGLEKPGHIASPDLHINHEKKRIELFCHGVTIREKGRSHLSRMLWSEDGLNFQEASCEIAPTYLRMFEVRGQRYGIAKAQDGTSPQVLLRWRGWGEPLEVGPSFGYGIRHVAVQVEGDQLLLFYSRAETDPESILFSTLSLQGDWQSWPDSMRDEQLLLQPERDYEGIHYPRAQSKSQAQTQVCQLRDPFFFREKGRNYLLYSVAGEMGLALAEV